MRSPVAPRGTERDGARDVVEPHNRSEPVLPNLPAVPLAAVERALRRRIQLSPLIAGAPGLLKASELPITGSRARVISRHVIAEGMTVIPCLRCPVTLPSSRVRSIRARNRPSVSCSTQPSARLGGHCVVRLAMVDGVQENGCRGARCRTMAIPKTPRSGTRSCGRFRPGTCSKTSS